MNVEVELSAARGEVIVCTASLTPLPERAGRSTGFGVILAGLTVPA